MKHWTKSVLFQLHAEYAELMIRPWSFDGNNSHYAEAARELHFGFARSKANVSLS